jgi:hypothetical protein
MKSASSLLGAGRYGNQSEARLVNGESILMDPCAWRGRTLSTAEKDLSTNLNFLVAGQRASRCGHGPKPVAAAVSYGATTSPRFVTFVL